LAVSHYVKRLLLHSEKPGTGKTMAGIMLAEATQADLTVLTMTDSTQASDLLGHWIPKGKEFVWHDGPVTRAIRRAISGKRSVLLVNEISNGGPDAMHVAYALLETGKAARFTLPSGEVLEWSPENLIVIATMNPKPDESGLPAAVLDRFQVTIDIGDHVSPMILDALPTPLASMVGDGRMTAREAFSLVSLTKDGCDPYVAVQAVLGTERAADYQDALAVSLS
jgi:midasin (ATPase involved in ribosome maturation)